jgi:hypothetical protein
MLYNFNSNGTKCPHPTAQEPTTLELLASRGIFPVKTHTQHPKDYYQFLCPLPGHANDRNPSFYVHQDGIRWKCFVCGLGGRQGTLIRLLGSEPIARTPKPPKPAKKATKKEQTINGCTLAQLAAAKNLPIEFLRSLGWHDTIYQGKPAVAIPWPGGTHYRVNLEDKPKYFWKKGSHVSILGLERLEAVRRGGWVLFIEGETDYAAGLLMGLPVIALPGASTFKDEWALQFQGCQIYVWHEPDRGGETFVKTLDQVFYGVQVIKAPAGVKDLCDLHDQAGEGARRFFEELKSEARLWRQIDSPKNVTDKVSNNNTLYLNRDITPKSQLWEDAKGYFPLPAGIKPWTISRGMYNHADGKGLIVEFPSNSWVNAANAQLKRQRLFFNMLPRLNGPQIYMMKVAVDDWSDQSHGAVKQRISRAIAKAGEDTDYGWCWFNNALERGYYLYLTSAPGVSGFQPFEDDIELVLVDGLRAIHPPRRGEETDGRFRPYGGSSNWISRVDGTGEKDREKWQIVAVSDAPADYVQAEAECVAADIPYEYARPYWRQQIGLGLEITLPFEDFMQLCISLGHHPTQAGRLELVGNTD